MLVSAIAISCVNLNGQLNVQQPMHVNRKGGFLNLKTIPVNLDQGSYRAELTLKSDKSLSLELKMPNDQKDIVIPIKSDSSLNVPSNGAIRISGSSIKQPFDINGTISTEYTNSPTVSGYESCTYTRTERRFERVCRDVSTGRNDRRGKHEICENEERTSTISETGSQFVVSHVLTTDRSLTAELKLANSTSQVATLNASGSESVRIIDSSGICR